MTTKTMKAFLGVAMAAAVVGGGVSLAAAKGKVDPKLPKEVQPMHGLVGEWNGKGKLNMRGQELELTLKISCKSTSGGYGVLCQSRFAGPGGMVMEGTDLFGYDPGLKKYHWYAVTSTGNTHDHVAEIPKEGGPIVFAHSGIEDGQPMQEVLTMSFNKECTQIAFTNDTVIGGKPAIQIVATVNKK